MTVARAPHLRRAGLGVTFIALAFIAAATLLPAPPTRIDSHLCLICGSFGTVDAALNVLLFIPLGIGLALAGVSGKRALLGMVVLSALIEVAQLLVIPSRYYGQVAPTLGNFALFPGRVVSAQIDSLRVSSGALAAGGTSLQRLLVAGAKIDAKIETGPAVDGVAPIIRVADDRKRQIILLAQKGDQLVFGVRTGAAKLRLRAPLFALERVFPLQAGVFDFRSESLEVSGSQQPNLVTLNSRDSTSHGNQIRITSSLGWTLWLPFQWFIAGTLTEQSVNWLWIWCFVVPFGFWSMRSVQPTTSAASRWNRSLWAVAAAALLCAALILIPWIFGISVAPLTDWLAGVLGLAMGAWAGGHDTGHVDKRSPRQVQER